jgi:nucleotide-binding universal stress UspA family protein
MVIDRARVVVGVDGTEASDLAVGYAAREAVLRKVPLRVVSAYAWPPNPSALPMYLPATGADLDALRRSAQLAVDTAIAQAISVAEDVQVEGTACEGMAPSVLLNEAAEAQLLVVGSRQLGAVGSFLLGSVGDAVATHATCPVLVTRGHQDVDTRDGAIVVGVTYAEASDPMLGFAFDEARLRAAPLWVVLCWHPDVGMPYRLLREAAAEARAAAEVWLSDVVDAWREKYPDVPVEIKVINQHPVIGLVERSRDQALLVVGSHGANALAATVLGSVCRGVLHHATCPVTVVPIKG